MCNYSNPNYKPKGTGSHKVEYEEDPHRRANKKWQRKQGLVKSAYNLSVIAGADVFVKFCGPPNPNTGGKRDIWVYSSSDDVYNEYTTNGIKPSTDVKEGRLNRQGDVMEKIFKPKPSNSNATPMPQASEGLSVNLMPDSYYVTPTKTVAADLNFANVAQDVDILGISSIDLPYVSQIVNIEPTDTPLTIEVIDTKEDHQEIPVPTSTPVPPVNAIIDTQAPPINSLEVTPTTSVIMNIPANTNIAPNLNPVPSSSPTIPIPASSETVSASGIAAGSGPHRQGPKDMVRKLVAKKIQFKREQGPVPPVVWCLVCKLRKLKKDAKWKWKSCLTCEKEAHTLCIGMSKTDKTSKFTCEACIVAKNLGNID